MLLGHAPSPQASPAGEGPSNSAFVKTHYGLRATRDDHRAFRPHFQRPSPPGFLVCGCEQHLLRFARTVPFVCVNCSTVVWKLPLQLLSVSQTCGPVDGARNAIPGLLLLHIRTCIGTLPTR